MFSFNFAASLPKGGKKLWLKICRFNKCIKLKRTGFFGFTPILFGWIYFFLISISFLIFVNHMANASVLKIYIIYSSKSSAISFWLIIYIIYVTVKVTNFIWRLIRRISLEEQPIKSLFRLSFLGTISRQLFLSRRLYYLNIYYI